MTTDLDSSTRWDGPAPAWEPDLLQGAIRAVMGREADITAIRPLGTRSLLIDVCVAGARQCVVALRQRHEDIRKSLPLQEEHALLCFLAEETPGLAVPPLGFQPGTASAAESLLFVQWCDGRRLGELIDPAQKPEEVLALLTPALQALHVIGTHKNRPALTRRIGTERMLQRAETWQPPQADVASSTWVCALDRVRCELRAVSPPTLLHGDGHAYNLLVAAGGQRWIDFECAAEGPPEMDFARMWVLLHSQAVRPLGSSARCPPQLACDFLAASEFLRQPPANATLLSLNQVQVLLGTTIHAILTSVG